MVTVLYLTGCVSIPLTFDWSDPQEIGDDEHEEAADRAVEWSVGWFAHPIFVDGDYPLSMQESLGKKLPVFTEQEKTKIKGTADAYTTAANPPPPI